MGNSEFGLDLPTVDLVAKDIISVPKNNYTKKLMSSVFSLKK